MRNWTQGEDLPTMIESLEIPEEEVLIGEPVPRPLRPPAAKMMARLYTTFDVLLNPAMGEGFGMPIMEAQACGVPVIVTDFSAMKEVVRRGLEGSRATLAGPGRSPGRRSAESARSSTRSRSATPDADDSARRSRRRRAQHALKYSAPKVLEEHFLPALAEVEKRLSRRRHRRSRRRW